MDIEICSTPAMTENKKKTKEKGHTRCKSRAAGCEGYLIKHGTALSLMHART